MLAPLPIRGQAGIPAESAATFERGVAHFRAGNFTDALATIEPLGARHPRVAEVQHLLAILLDLNRRPQEANEKFQRAVELQPASAVFRTNFGASLMRLGHATEAADQFRKVLESEPDHSTASFNLGTILLRQGRPDQALPWLENAHALQPEIYQNAYQLAFCHVTLGNHQEADEVLARLAGDPGSRAEVRLLRALTDRALGRGDRTGQVLQSIKPAIAAEPQLQFQLAMLLLAHDLPGAAEELLVAVAKHLPASYPAHFNLSVAQHRLGKLSEATQAAKDALALEETAEAHLLLGDLFEAQTEPLKAVEHMQRAVALDPAPQHYYALGYEFLAHWNWEAASRVFAEGLERHGDSWSLWIGSGSAALGLTRHDEAARAFLQAARLRPAEMMGYRLLAQVFDQSEDAFGEAVRCLRQLAEREPENPWARYMGALATVRESSRSGDPAATEPPLEALAEITRENPRFLEAQLLLGEVQFELQDWAAAVTALERATELDPSHVQAHYRLGLALQRTGESARATETLLKYRELKAGEDRSVGKRVAATTRFIVDLRDDGDAR